jgi:hypothetical protein
LSQLHEGRPKIVEPLLSYHRSLLRLGKRHGVALRWSSSFRLPGFMLRKLIALVDAVWCGHFPHLVGHGKFSIKLYVGSFSNAYIPVWVAA